ncbi:hypothetical protein JRO89_XS15G0110700 [Xanthoceras sorbifolium]|uniref:Uncharacterized protein n=1 Tax=Xanthoceras sorbifolium TaxID=99658 RepID=A0ABQ8H1M9_9ROSI|nr:hypothetical protein JRO89_XS15G0110700 [Xanthoceras sorbifolium]
MKICIISRELIKPSSPTPHHLRTHKLSLLDQLAPDNYFPTILYYSQTNKNAVNCSDHLKKSLSKTLTDCYPLAGRFRDDSFIDCDDYGATFIEARVAGDMSDVFKLSDVDLLEQLLPCDVNPQKLSVDHSIIAIQVNYFECGGVAICFCFRHSVVDATAGANFIKNWATVARGGNDIKDVIFDYTSIFPPQDLSHLSKSFYQVHYSPLTDSVTKRFMFDGTKVAALREEISKGPCLDRPTRFEAVTALIWGAVIGATRETDDDFTRPRHVAKVSVNLQKRMNTTIPEHRIGNIYQVTFADWPMEKTIDYNSLAGKLRESITMMNDFYARKLNKGGGLILNYLANLGDDQEKSKINVFGFSGWCKLPFYEADFGWGKPLRVSTAPKMKNFAVLLDCSDGQGIEAWIGLSKEDMSKFEKDPNIRAFASFSPSATCFD